MAVISLPLSFNNSFWTQDYRTGLEVIFRKLEQARPFRMRERWLAQSSIPFTCAGHS